MAFQATERLVFTLWKWEIIGWLCSLSGARVLFSVGWLFLCACDERQRCLTLLHPAAARVTRFLLCCQPGVLPLAVLSRVPSMFWNKIAYFAVTFLLPPLLLVWCAVLIHNREAECSDEVVTAIKKKMKGSVLCVLESEVSSRKIGEELEEMGGSVDRGCLQTLWDSRGRASNSSMKGG